MVIIEQIFQLLAPHDCVSCGKEGRLLCPSCTRGLGILPKRCYICHQATPYGKTCAGCRQYSVLRHVWVRTEYGHTAKKVIHGLKFDHARDTAKLIAGEMAGLLPHPHHTAVLVHVPAATSHVRLRGFDQSALIAKEMARVSGIRHMHLLGRSGQQRQVGSSNQVRRTQMEDAFRPLSSSVIKGTRIILVDDVLTTGSTLEAAATALKEAGAKTVDAVVFAQTL